MGECYAAAVFQCVEGFGILVEFQQFDFRMTFGEEGIGGGAFVDQKGLVFQLRNVGNRFVFGGKPRPRPLSCKDREIDGFGAFGCLGEVGEDEVDFAGTDVFDAVCGLGQDEFDFVGAAKHGLWPGSLAISTSKPWFCRWRQHSRTEACRRIHRYG